VRVPVKSEAEAFHLAWGGVLVIAICIVVGALTAPLVGVALFVAILLGLVGWELATKDPAAPKPLSDALAAGRQGAARHKRRTLVIANQTMLGRELRDEIARRNTGETELRMVAPVMPTRAHYVASDIDGELREARTRLDAALAWASQQGFEATGRVGDMTPLVAIEDELRSGGADEVIISTHVAQRSHWLESGLVERAREELDIPVTHVVVDLANQEVQVSTSEQAAS
jgi:GABA permease